MISDTIKNIISPCLWSADTDSLDINADTYLASGTDVSIYLNHRISVDIDLFTDEKFYCGPIISCLGQKHAITVTNLAEKNTIIAIIDNVRFRENMEFLRNTVIR